ncbi:MAG TPA: hypothetical protein DEG17_25855 [Cyanobacteria bacterium UBA11149]|nr:hypothetical protein [Cyanobacteria bacterium UBA11367]HBE58321.1 hypothetical protein [Cyanobacteria bacterium UBA11366]HBK63293.1 hypothetical protein [Cyanobacteria bacterium UBA11166]HBR76817.1 hypothetical protein [Cyanobacteria bacterium UBA11159]HBS71302.1 hypothetical protein [Cyanobacteria bacterium UBA11153]HBW92197.1 hypothetical protein [Cyanobacteria bacterium UBA11149]HCA95813.1 hypothetical protein [Cyanobacteria bacterium UBA9226]
MYVYRTSEFNRKAERYNIRDRIYSLCDNLETQRLDEAQAHFERVYPYLKRRILNYRVICRVVKVDDDEILCFLDIFNRGAREYDDFLNAPGEYGKIHWQSLLDFDGIRESVALSKIQKNPIEVLPELPHNFRPWLEPPGWQMERTNGDWIICETEEWVSNFSQPNIKKNWRYYYQLVAQINSGTLTSSLPTDMDDGDTLLWGQEVQREEEERTLLTTEDGKITPDRIKLCGNYDAEGERIYRYILYSQIKTTDATIGGVLFLLAAFDRKPSSQDVAEVGNKTALFNGANTDNILARELNIHELTPFARRSYPAYLLADEESWLAIEGGAEANLALSPEEEQILQSVSTPGGSSTLPLFINGRAGSGKSTMLIYLFADYCYRKYYNEQGERRSEILPGELLFLTYNERLLDVARDGVKRLLSSHHRFLTERSQMDELPDIDSCFQPFQKFLFNLLPPEEQSRFNPDKYISFHRFKQLYNGFCPHESFAKAILKLRQYRDYSPETSWHVIRSFIKGYGQPEAMTPEDYQEEVPRKERTIDLEKFQGIYDSIWERWYKHITQEEGYWDDQDLIARVLELKCYHPHYVAIFCDEAQDFTRLELQLIMKLSLFSQYNLGYRPINCLPFSFAGDPFQTLNPTGFRWSSIQSAFDGEVITAIDPAGQLKLAVNFQELTFNYRSTPPIVEFINLIQLWRYVLFNIQEIKPQTPWHPGNFPEPQKFILNQNITASALANYIKDTIVIVPCEEGEEAAYVKEDEILSQIFPQLNTPVVEAKSNQAKPDSNGDRERKPTRQSPEPIKNILSAVAAKGLEFKKVILYKFGEACNQNVWNLKKQPIDEKIKIEYFFNKLYVAASRATAYLFVVDSEKGDRQLWEYASDEALLQAMLGFAKNTDIWQDKVKTLTPGTPKTMEELQELEPIAIAIEFETKGLTAENSSLLRRAKQFYTDLGDHIKGKFCEAWALKFEGQFQEAGTIFQELGNDTLAWDCFWAGCSWQELVNWYQQHPATQTIERHLAIFMASSPQDLAALDNFTSLAFELQYQLTSKGEELTNTRQWKQTIIEYGKRIESLKTLTDVTSETWQKFGDLLTNLNFNAQLNLLASDCFYLAQNYQQAIWQWETCQATQNPLYHRAKAKLMGIPDGLAYLEKAARYDLITIEWEEAGKPRDRNWLKYVALALENQAQYQQALIVYIWMDELIKAQESFRRASQGGVTIKLLTIICQYFFRKNYWGEAIETINKYLDSVTGSPSKIALFKFDIVYELALSDLKREDLTKEQRKSYATLIKDQVLSNPAWQNHLSIHHLGIALEKLGGLVNTLEFYEEFIEDSEPEISQFARERWLVTKKKQVDYARHQNKPQTFIKTQSELLKKAQAWQISIDSLSPIPPTAPKQRPITGKETINYFTIGSQENRDKNDSIFEIKSRSSPHQEAKLTSNIPIGIKSIEGLPRDTKITKLENDILQFKIRHLVVKIMKESKQILITDSLNNREVRIDAKQSQINIGDAAITSPNSQELSFTFFHSNYSGKLLVDKLKSRLELNVQGLNQTIFIHL